MNERLPTLTSKHEKPWRVGIVGMGAAAQAFLPAFAKHPGFDWVAFAEPDEQLRVKHAQPSSDKSGPVGFASLPEMLALEGGLDVVYVATPTDLHLQHVKSALAAGCHVLVEKPMASRLDEALEMVKAAELSGKLLMVGHSHSYDRPILEMRRLIESGALGRVQMVHTWCFTDWMYRPRRAEELDHRLGGGVTYRQGAHQFDIIRFLCGGLVRSVRAKTFDWDPQRRGLGAHTVFFGFRDGTSRHRRLQRLWRFIQHGLGVQRLRVGLCSSLGRAVVAHQALRWTDSRCSSRVGGQKSPRRIRHSGCSPTPAVLWSHLGEL